MGYPIRNINVECAHAYKQMPSEMKCYTLSQEELQKYKALHPTKPMKRPITVNLTYNELKRSHALRMVEEGITQGFSDVEIAEHYDMKIGVVRRMLTLIRRRRVV